MPHPANDPDNRPINRIPLLRLSLLMLAVSLSPTAHADEKFRIVPDLAFAPHAPQLRLSLWLPARKGPLPCVLALQGGGFLPQTGNGYRGMAEYLASHGFAAALVAYRGRPEQQFPDTLADVRAAAKFLRKNAHTWQLDTTKFAAIGGSAGGTLAALLATTADETDPDCRIQAAVCFAGVFDFVSRFQDPLQLELQPAHAEKLKTNQEWIGAPFAPTATAWLQASPMTHLSPGDPPILLLHSRNDSTVPWLQSQLCHNRMQQLQLTSELIIYPDGGHGVNPSNGKPRAEMLRFLRRHLGVSQGQTETTADSKP